MARSLRSNTSRNASAKVLGDRSRPVVIYAPSRVAIERRTKRQLRTDLPQDLRYAMAYVDDKPDFLYAIAAARGFSHAALLRSGIAALRGGLVHFDKKAGMFIADRDGDGFEVMLVHGLEPSDEAEAMGQKLFGSLKISTY